MECDEQQTLKRFCNCKRKEVKKMNKLINKIGGFCRKAGRKIGAAAAVLVGVASVSVSQAQVALPAEFTTAIDDGKDLAALAGVAFLGLVLAIGVAKLTAKIVRKFMP
jgi:hypothetical protein